MSLMLRDSHTASSNFGLAAESYTKIPKPKFLYFVRFVRTNSGAATNDWSKGVGIIAKNIDRPKISFDTEVVNQYNKKRVVQKRVEYDPLSITFHDTVDNKVFHMFEDYFRFYYADPRQGDAVDWSWDINSSSMWLGQAGGYGFVPPLGTDTSFFFSHIELYTFYGGKYARWDIINPKVKSFNPGDMNYAESEGAEIQMSFEYEAILYKGNNFDLASQDGLLTEMGLSASSFYEPRTSSGSADPGQSSTYAGDGAAPTYGTAELAATSTSTSDSSSTAVSRSSSIVDSNLSFNSIFTGVITRPASAVTTLVSGVATQGDNIAKRIWNGMK